MGMHDSGDGYDYVYTNVDTLYLSLQSWIVQNLHSTAFEKLYTINNN
jgi:hypothetical protein